MEEVLDHMGDDWKLVSINLSVQATGYHSTRIVSASKYLLLRLFLW